MEAGRVLDGMLLGGMWLAATVIATIASVAVAERYLLPPQSLSFNNHARCCR